MKSKLRPSHRKRCSMRLTLDARPGDGSHCGAGCGNGYAAAGKDNGQHEVDHRTMGKINSSRTIACLG
eukprot:1305749-Prymnesium_polylepis.1